MDCHLSDRQTGKGKRLTNSSACKIHKNHLVYFNYLLFFANSKVRAKKVDVSSKKGVWVQIELKKLVAQWFRHPNENLGLAIHSYDKDGNELAVIEASDNEDNSLVSDLWHVLTSLEIIIGFFLNRRYRSSKSE
jgi:hypothetical protein